LLLSPSNVLILDEPTNHLDIQSKQVLKQALQQYEGTFLIVSHDREFLDGLTNRIWDIENKTLKIHHFGVHEYLERKMSTEGNNNNNGAPVLKKKAEKAEEIVVAAPAVSGEERKELKRQRNQLSSKVKQLEDQVKSLEAEVEKLNERLAEIDFSDVEQSAPVLKAFETAKTKLDETTDAWLEASETLETIPVL